jgi:ADP-ribosyl-[dinitrogen reductase] hydrolase
VLVELAIGDAYGAGFEYSDPDFVVAHNTLDDYVQHPRHIHVRPGQYTDDTQMTLAIAELLLADADWTPENLAAKFVEVYRRDERYGYAERFHEFLRTVDSGAEFLARIHNNSDRSGAAMRVTPIGLLGTVDDVLHHAAIQARVTHNTPAGVEAAQAAALAVHYCHHRLGHTKDLTGWLDQLLPGDWSQPWHGPVGAQGLMSVRAAITALVNADSLSALLRTCVDYTGDVDTVAAIALSAGSRCADLVQDIPRNLYNTLENGHYGRDYLSLLSNQLLTRHPRNVAGDTRADPAEGTQGH